MDEELLAAFREEFAPLCAALAEAADLGAAQRLLAQMRAMADGMEIAPIQARLAPLAEEEELGTLRAAAAGLAALAAGEAEASAGPAQATTPAEPAQANLPAEPPPGRCR